MWSALVLGVLCCTALSTVSAIYTKDRDTEYLTRNAMKDSDVFVLKVSDPNPGLHKSYVETLFKFEFPGTDNDFQLKLDRTEKRVLIESKNSGKPITEGWSVKDDLLDDGIFKSLVLEVTQDIMGARYTLYLDCVDHGTVAMTTSLKKMLNQAKKPHLRLTRDRLYSLQVFADQSAGDILNQDNCSDEDHKMIARDLRSNEVDPRYRGRERERDRDRDLTPSGRSDIPIAHECDDNLLFKTINELKDLIKRLQLELEAQRAETRSLRDYIDRCNVCRPGEDYRQ